MKTKKQTTILFLAASLLCVVGKSSEGKDSGRQGGKPNVLFIAIDDLNDWTWLPLTATGVRSPPGSTTPLNCGTNVRKFSKAFLELA